MSALDQSLDEILSSKPKRQQRRKQTGAKVTKKTTTPASKKTPTGPKKGAAPKAKATSVVDASYATKIVVYGLPKDIKYDSVKDFFSSQVGGVQSVQLTYNEKGQSKGIATVVFKSAANAKKAFETYNGAPIDGGVSKLKVELIVDPTKKPLANRILANAVVTQKKQQPNQPKKAAAAKPKPAQPKQKKAAAKPKTKRPAKKTVEQLDQEMADYFEKKD